MTTWAPLFIGYYSFLQLRVVNARVETGKQIEMAGGEADSSDPLYVSVHSATEYATNVPMGLLLATLAELNGARAAVLHAMLGSLFVLRVAHVELGTESTSKSKSGIKFGQYGSIAWLAGMGAYAFYLGWPVTRVWAGIK